MAFITVNELHTTGAELFQDSESFLNELNDIDHTVHGGDNYSGATNAVLGIVQKGFEFGVITIGIDAIVHLAKSYSHDNAPVTYL